MVVHEQYRTRTTSLIWPARLSINPSSSLTNSAATQSLSHNARRAQLQHRDSHSLETPDTTFGQQTQAGLRAGPITTQSFVKLGILHVPSPIPHSGRPVTVIRHGSWRRVLCLRQVMEPMPLAQVLLLFLLRGYDKHSDVWSKQRQVRLDYA